MFWILFAFIFCFILFQFARGIAVWIDNNHQPIESVPATVYTKKVYTNVNTSMDADGHISTTYNDSYEVVFLTSNGEYKKYYTPHRIYRSIQEGDHGTLTFQGTRFHNFV